MNFILNKILKLLCTASILISVLFFVSCRNENSLQLNYSNVWNYAQSRTLQFQCVLNSTEEMDPNVFNTVLTQISGTAALEYNRGSCTFIMQSIKVKITAGEVDFNYDSSAKYTDEKDILRNTPFAILLDKRLVCSFNESGRIINIDRLRRNYRCTGPASRTFRNSISNQANILRLFQRRYIEIFDRANHRWNSI